MTKNNEFPPGRLARSFDRQPALTTPDEAAALLRTSRKAIYVMAERGLLPGVTRIGRRLLFRTDALIDFLDQKSAPSPKE